MTDLLWLSDDQLDRIKPYFPLSHGVPRVDDHRVVSGIVFVIKNGLRWRDAPKEYGPHKTLYNRFIRWSRMGVFDRIFANLAGQSGRPDRLIIDATHLKAHRTAASLFKKGCSPPYWPHERRPELEASCSHRWRRQAFDLALERRANERSQRGKAHASCPAKSQIPDRR